MKILFLCDSPNSHGGYSNQARMLAHRLGKIHDVKYLGFQSFGHSYQMIYEGEKLNFEVICNVSRHNFGHHSFIRKLPQLKPDIVIQLGDLWMIADNLRDPNQLQRPFAFCSLFPVDAPPLVQHQIDALRITDIPICLTNYGKRICKDHGFDVNMIPHGLDFNISKPLNFETVSALRGQLGLTNKKLILFVFRNQPRKVPQVTMDAIRKSSIMKRNDAVVLFWTDPQETVPWDSDNTGWDIRQIRKEWNLIGKVILPEDLGINYDVMDGFSSVQMNQLYNCADFGLNLTCGEGFSLTPVEQLSVGKPVICTDATTLPEVSGPGALLIDVAYTNEAQSAGVKRFYADAKKAAEAIDTLLDNPTLCYELGQKGLEHVHKNYNADNVAEEFIKLFDKAMGRFK